MRHCLAVIAVVLPVLAHAQSAHQLVAGSRLSLDIPCLLRAEIARDPALTGQVVVDAKAANQGEIDQLDIAGGEVARVKLRRGCWRPAVALGFSPTLALSIRVPAAFPVSIDASGDGDFHVDVGGPLELDSSGSARVDVTDTKALHADMSGSGHASFSRVLGPIHADMSGSGEIAIAHALAAVEIDLSGSGRFSIGDGQVSALKVDSSGSGSVSIGGTVDAASIDVSGSGSVDLARVTGALAQETSGSGTVTVRSR